MYRSPCSKCGSTDIPRFRQIKNRGNGIKKLSIASYCIQCQKEDASLARIEYNKRPEVKLRKKIQYKIWYSKNKNIAYKHSRKWIIKNREKMVRYHQDWYIKNKKNKLKTKKVKDFIRKSWDKKHLWQIKLVMGNWRRK